jgi:hypothetical protein
MVGSSRCRLHGGASTGPRTEQGKERARINGSKGGRPRIHQLPQIVEVSAQSAKPAPETLSVEPESQHSSTGVALVKCRDCANVSAAFTCLAVKGKAGRLDMGTPHACVSFQANMDGWG